MEEGGGGLFTRALLQVLHRRPHVTLGELRRDLSLFYE